MGCCSDRIFAEASTIAMSLLHYNLTSLASFMKYFYLFQDLIGRFLLRRDYEVSY